MQESTFSGVDAGDVASRLATNGVFVRIDNDTQITALYDVDDAKRVRDLVAGIVTQEKALPAEAPAEVEKSAD